ncbi:MAG: HigA family addiction module antidote protein [Armatimonadetes bacterium]|nr:HigA family addiction module antidote protein [Armatimonadota bacterium]
MRIPTHRSPTHPGEMLEEEFMKPLGLSQSRLAELLEVPFQRINRIVNKKQAVTIDTALRLSALLGTSPQFWLNLQHGWDLYEAMHSKEAHQIQKTIRPFSQRRAASSTSKSTSGR